MKKKIEVGHYVDIIEGPYESHFGTVVGEMVSDFGRRYLDVDLMSARLIDDTMIVRVRESDVVQQEER